jgi:hypothetical protein
MGIKKQQKQSSGFDPDKAQHAVHCLSRTPIGIKIIPAMGAKVDLRNVLILDTLSYQLLSICFPQIETKFIGTESMRTEHIRSQSPFRELLMDILSHFITIFSDARP